MIASILGSVAAAMACESEGNQPIDPDEMIKRLDQLERHGMLEPVQSVPEKDAPGGPVRSLQEALLG